MTKTRGSLYFLRDVDFLSGKKGPYIKIGIVRNDKSTEERISEHQTGNPRGIINEYTLTDVPFVEALETQLHYYFNHLWVNGEWFVMDEQFVQEKVIEVAKRFREEQLEFEHIINRADELSGRISNGKSKTPKNIELQLRDVYHEVKFQMEMATAELKIAKSALLATIGKVGFVEGIFHLSKRKDGVTFDTKSFQGDLEELYNEYCMEKEGGFSNTFKILGGIKLKTKDENLYNAVKKLPKDSYSTQDLHKNKDRTHDIEELHWEYLKSQRKVKLLEWDLIKMSAQLKVATGEFDAIEGVCTWERKDKDPKMVLNTELLKEHHPDIHSKYLVSKIGNIIPNIERSRAYQPSI